MGRWQAFREQVRDARDLSDRQAHIRAQGFPESFEHLALGFEPEESPGDPWPSGRLSAEARQDYGGPFR